MRDRETSAMKPSHSLRFGLGVLDARRVHRLFRFKYRVYALGRNYLLVLKIKDERRVLRVVDDYIDLVTKVALAIDNVSSVCLIPLRKVLLQEFKPYSLTG